MAVGIVDSLLSDPEETSDAVADAEARAVTGELDTVVSADPAALIVDSLDAVRTAVEAEISIPLLPVGTAPGLGPVRPDSLAEAVRAVEAGRSETVERRGLTLVLRGRDPALAIADVSVVTAEPATISEFEISTGEDHVATYRADGTVVATPAGSSGYARAVGGPILDPETAGIVVITIAPYRTDPDHWVLGEAVEVTVARDESDVVVVTDGTDLGPVASWSPISITADRSYRTLRVPQSRSPFETKRP